MAMQDTVSYQERIQVVIDERALTSSIQRAEREYQQMVQRFNRQKQLELQVRARDDASRVFQNINRQSQQLTRAQHTVRVNVNDTASAQLRSINNVATQLGRRSVSIRVGVNNQATQALNAITRQASRAALSPVRTAGNVISAAAPGIVGMEAPAVGGALMAGGLAGGVLAAGTALGVATHDAMDFGRAITQVQNNTTMSQGEIDTLRGNVLALSNEFGLSKQPLMDAARQIQDLTQNADAMNGIMSVAAETAASTGADVNQVGQVLANTLHQYRLDQGDAAAVTERAAHAMGVLHVASAEGNMTMQQFSDSSGRAIALAGQLGVPLEQVTGALATLTRNGFDAAQSQTQLVNIFTRVIRPAKDAEKQIAALSKSSGVDLVSAYTATGLQTLGLTGIFDRTTAAYRAMGMTQGEATQETLNLMNAQRGGIGAALLMGKGASDLNQIMGDLTNTQLTDTYVANAWSRSLEQPSVQFDRLGQRINTAMINLGTQMIPVVNRSFIWMGLLWPEIQNVGTAFGNLLGPILGVTSPLDAIDHIVNDAQVALHNFSQWLGEVATYADQNGAIADLHTAFTNIKDALKPALEVLNPFREGLGAVDTSSNGIDTGSHGAADGLKAFASAAKDITGQIQPFLEVLKDIERTLNGISAWEASHRPTITVAGQEQKGLVSTLPLQAEQATGTGVTPIQAAQNAWDYFFGGRQGKIAEAEAGMGNDGRTLGRALSDGLVVGSGQGTRDLREAGANVANEVTDATREALDSHSPSGVYMSEGQNIVLGLTQGITTQSQTSLPGAVQGMVDLIRSSFTQSMSNGAAFGTAGGAAGGSLNDWINQAVQQSGVDPGKWAGNLQSLIMHESGGDPNARNNWDVNAQAGNASVGLGQLTGTNRARYTPQGMDPMDPVAQVMATIGYIRDRYGDIGNVPGIRSLAAGGAYKPYQAGGIVGEPSLMVSMRTGQPWGTIAESAPERVVPTSMTGAGGGGGSFSPQFTIVQQPGEDGEALARRVSTHIAQLVPAYFARFSQHIGESLGNMPAEAFS
jgi:TP901 family phage tail tape measure protein